MRKFCLSFLVLAIAVTGMGCPSSAIQKKAVRDLDATHKLIFPEYIRLIEKKYAPDAADSSEDAEDKKAKIQRRKDFVKSANDLVDGLEAAVKE